MSGIGLLLSTAKDALLAQQLALDVVSHNIANVNTPGYSRQIPELATRQPAPYAGMMLGRGVAVEDIIRNTDAFIEKRLQQRKTDLSSLKEQEVYMSALEAIFNESSGRSLSSALTEFWNAWHDLANNPSGASERGIVYERAALLCQAFNSAHEDLSNLTGQINLSIETGIQKINELTEKIADLNQQILSGRINGNPNDLLDKRNQLVTELGQYLDINYYKNEDGSLTVTTGRGYVL
ncbi:MAG: flagellar hook-associated protein FlgK, partial [Deltaproteobacteria bacterium]